RAPAARAERPIHARLAPGDAAQRFAGRIAPAGAARGAAGGDGAVDRRGRRGAAAAARVHPAGRRARRGRAPLRAHRVPARRAPRRDARRAGARAARDRRLPEPPLRLALRVCPPCHEAGGSRRRAVGAGTPLTPHERGLAMAERVRATVARELDEAAGTRVQQAVIAALQARHALAPKDVRYLHPGRVPLILVDDAGVRDETLLV